MQMVVPTILALLTYASHQTFSWTTDLASWS